MQRSVIRDNAWEHKPSWIPLRFIQVAYWLCYFPSFGGRCPPYDCWPFHFIGGRCPPYD